MNLDLSALIIAVVTGVSSTVTGLAVLRRLFADLKDEVAGNGREIRTMRRELDQRAHHDETLRQAVKRLEEEREARVRLESSFAEFRAQFRGEVE